MDVALRGGNAATPDPEITLNERDVFINALQKGPTERTAYLDEACAANPALRRRIDLLLEAHDDPDSFLDLPPAVDATSIGTLGQDRPLTLADDAAAPDESQATANVAKAEATLAYDLPEGPTSPPAPRPITEGPGSRIGPYKLLQKIGEGGMGAVYMAEQEKPVRRRVALKIIKPGMDTDQVVARFEAERQALALMDHHSIAKVFDAGATESGRPYFVMELVNGIPITDYCDRANLSPRERLDLFIPVCHAIQHAHQKGVIHRDVKPSNILVTLHDGKPVPKVIDFGIAKAISQRLTERTMFTQFGAVVGTLEYMSPEQAEMSGMDVDTRTDVYALGVLLYELLTGTTPLQRASLREAAFAEILRRIREEEPQKPSTRISESGENLASISAHRKTEPVRLTKLVRGELDWIVMKALEKDRGRRYETANGFAQDVRRYLDGDAVEACPPSATYKLKKFARKHRAALATVGAFAFLLVAATAVSAGLAVWANRERVRAVTAENAAKAQQGRAEEREQMAIDAVKRFGDVIRETPELKNNPALAPLRSKLLKEPQAFFKRLRDQLQADKETTPGSLARLGSAGYDLGRITDEIGDKVEALRAYEESLAIRERLARENPSVTQFQSDLATILSRIGRLQIVIGRQTEAMAPIEQGRAIRERLAHQNPSVTQFQSDLAASHANIGYLQHSMGQPTEAMAAFEQALAIRERLVRGNPSVTQFQNELAYNHHQIGLLKYESGRATEALESQEQARAIWERLARENPSATEFQNSLAGTYTLIGSAQDERRQHAEALASFEQARAIWERLVRSDLSITEYQGNLATIYSNVGMKLQNMGRPTEALASYEKARQIGERLARENPSDTEMQSQLASSHSNIGDLQLTTGRPVEAMASCEQARAIWERLTRENPESSDFASRMGMTLDIMGEIELHHRRFDKAREKLLQAVELASGRPLAANPQKPYLPESIGS